MDNAQRQKVLEQKKHLKLIYVSEKEKTPLFMSSKAKKIVALVVEKLKNDRLYYSNGDFDELFWQDGQYGSSDDLCCGYRGEVLRHLLEPKQLSILERIWSTRGDYPYQVGYYRRSYRSKKNLLLYKAQYSSYILSFINLVSRDCLDTYDFLDDRLEHGYNNVITHVIADYINMGDRKLISHIEDTVLGENNTFVVTRNIIMGCLRSDSDEMHRLMGNLLLAAKLQEGLRQSIVESVDEASPKAFKYILKLILDNNLQRFSSIVRAFGVWMNLAELDVSRPSVTTKCLTVAYECITDSSFIAKYLESPDKMEMYIALWAVAFYDVEDVFGRINELYDSGVKYKQIVALFFLSSVSFGDRQNQFVLEHIGDQRDMEVCAWLFNNLNIYKYTSSLASRWNRDKEPVKPLYTEAQAKAAFETMNEIYTSMNKQEIHFEDSGFHWVSTVLSRDSVLYHMIYLAYCTHDVGYVERLIPYLSDMSVSTRYFFLRCCFSDLSSAIVRQTFLEFLADKGSDVREEAEKQFKEKNLDLTDEEYVWIEGLLRRKNMGMRKMALEFLMKQEPQELTQSIERLLLSKTLDSRLGGLDLVIKAQEKSELQEVVTASLEIVSNMRVKSPKEKVLIDRLLNKEDKPRYNLENGFGLFAPNISYSLPVPAPPSDFKVRDIFSAVPYKKYEVFLKEFDKLVEKHKDYEYESENWNGEMVKVVLGAENYIRKTKYRLEEGEKDFDFLPLSDVWKEFFETSGIDSNMIYVLKFCIRVYQTGEIQDKKIKTFVEKVFPMRFVDDIATVVKSLNYRNIITSIISFYYPDGYDAVAYDNNYKTSLYLIENIPDEFYKLEVDDWGGVKRKKNMALNCIWLSYSMRELGGMVLSDEKFSEVLPIWYKSYLKSDYKEYRSTNYLSVYDLSRAYELGIMTENQMYKELMTVYESPSRISTVTGYRNKFTEKYPKTTKLVEILVDRVVDIESGRGDSPTEVTSLAMAINKYYGMEHFVTLVSGLDSKDTLVRGYYYSGGTSKKNAISNLIKTCYPKDGEELAKFKALLKERPTDEAILIRVAMYAPQWVDIITSYIGWKGLASACWYFIAHTHENMDDQKMNVIAKYSPIEKQDFVDGAFDIDWFKSCYKDLGEKRFKLVYDSAKYLTSGGTSHRRAQLFADATLGKLDLSESETRISEKRNKDYLICYGLIPLSRSKTKDTLKRYNFIQRFLKQSKSFGAQRRASEALASRIAMENLARNAGYSDVVRLTWSMEAENIKSMFKYFEPKEIDVYNVYIEALPGNKISVVAEKGGKRLKSVPTALKKNKYVLELKEAVKNLREQYRRTKESLEKVMETEDVLRASELMSLEKNPALRSMVQTLVFKWEDELGYLKDGMLIDLDGRETKLKPSGKLFIAHPVHLYESGRWAEFQKNIFEREIVQPFKQVFRELYMPNKDELSSKTSSMRYAGHQLQPGKLSALMKTKGWIAGGEKIYYKRDIVATLYGIPDYFSPGDVEAPTLHSLEFSSRKNYKTLEFTDIPKIIFSETMRDVDLFVSVAHVGGVDPEASLSTVEMRSAIIREMLPLLKLDNVEIKGNHAHIRGKYGEYTVHIGSGVVHKMAYGSVNILAVGSQHRGRLFLPFVDDDPRTAEIVSKIVMLGQDDKIKDPSILSQIS